MNARTCKLCKKPHEAGDELKCLGNRFLGVVAERDLLRIEVALMAPVIKAAISHKEPPFICTRMREAIRDYVKATKFKERRLVDKIEVKVGQVWEDWDIRMRGSGRKLKVLEIVGDRAIVQHPDGGGAKTKIKLSRFRPNATGYRLVSES